MDVDDGAPSHFSERFGEDNGAGPKGKNQKQELPMLLLKRRERSGRTGFFVKRPIGLTRSGSPIYGRWEEHSCHAKGFERMAGGALSNQRRSARIGLIGLTVIRDCGGMKWVLRELLALVKRQITESPRLGVKIQNAAPKPTEGGREASAIH